MTDRVVPSPTKPEPQECPICRSNRREFRGNVYGATDIFLCADPWHAEAVAPSVSTAPSYLNRNIAEFADLSTDVGAQDKLLGKVVVLIDKVTQKEAINSDLWLLGCEIYDDICATHDPVQLREAASLPQFKCSFCHKVAEQVTWLISNPADYGRAYICNECVGVCVELLNARISPDHKTTAQDDADTRKALDGSEEKKS